MVIFLKFSKTNFSNSLLDLTCRSLLLTMPMLLLITMPMLHMRLLHRHRIRKCSFKQIFSRKIQKSFSIFGRFKIFHWVFYCILKLFFRTLTQAEEIEKTKIEKTKIEPTSFFPKDSLKELEESLVLTETCNSKTVVYSTESVDFEPLFHKHEPKAAMESHLTEGKD